jgi:hypothetical protein
VEGWGWPGSRARVAALAHLQDGRVAVPQQGGLPAGAGGPRLHLAMGGAVTLLSLSRPYYILRGETLMQYNEGLLNASSTHGSPHPLQRARAQHRGPARVILDVHPGPAQ